MTISHLKPSGHECRELFISRLYNLNILEYLQNYTILRKSLPSFLKTTTNLEKHFGLYNNYFIV